MKLARVGNKTSHGRACYADGGRVSEDISDPGSLPVMSKRSSEGIAGIDGAKAKPRLDRKSPSTTVNIVVSSSKPEPAAPPMPMGGPPMPPPAAMPPPGLPMRARGGRVCKADGGAIHSTNAGRKKEERSEDSYKVTKHSKVLDAVTGLKRAFQGKDPRNVAQNSITGVKAQRMTDREKLGYRSGGRVTASGQSSASEKQAEARSVGRKDGGRVSGAQSSSAPSDRRSEESYEDNKKSSAAMTAVSRALRGKEWRNQAQNSVTGLRAEKMGRKHGGRVMDAGAGGGLGRLEKAKDYGSKPAKGK